MLILAYESSCDESSVALLEDGGIAALQTVTQSVHQPFGGVVPELAGRSHLELLDRLTVKSLHQAERSLDGVDLVCATVGPGLVGSLLVGSNYARGLCLALEKPFRAIHHVEAHLWSAELEHGPLPLPFLVLLVSGGHTQTVLVRDLRDYDILGTTLDDALGEAYDKVGKLLGLDFPAGAEVDRLARDGDSRKFVLTRPALDRSTDFSFSGLKTAVLYTLRDHPSVTRENQAADILAAFQESALSSVMKKVRNVAEATRPRAMVAAGGVAAKSRLRSLLTSLATSLDIPAIFPRPSYCMDNAAMIGYLAWKLEQAGLPLEDASVRPRWPLDALTTEIATS